MSCALCHHITGHAPDCRDGLADRQVDQDDLRARVERLEQKLEGLERHVLDYAQLKKLYAESRDYVRTLEHERVGLFAANRAHVAEINQGDAKIGLVYETAKGLARAWKDDRWTRSDLLDRLVILLEGDLAQEST